MRILIAEDDFTSRTVLTGVLKKHGHEVVATVNGMEAWNTMQQPDAPRLAIFDWMMPELDGVEVCRRIRALETYHPPYLIILTTKGEKANIIAGLEVGADDYLAKPFDPGELRARVEVGRRVVELQQALAKRISELEAALNQVKLLQGIIPICCHCHKIRTDQKCWEQMEKYITEHSEAKFSHAICPECLKELYPEFKQDDDGSAPL
jgi:DNA-binding response OmpR family regulator